MELPMKQAIRPALTILLSGIWVNASEFFRNEILLKNYWIGHFKSLGMTFPSEPRNGIVWVVWGFVFAAAIYSLSRSASLLRTTILGWLFGFVMMWLATWNLNVLPLAILLYAVPLSLLETFVASYISQRFSPCE
jgi:hypothetical protein